MELHGINEIINEDDALNENARVKIDINNI